MNKVWTSVRLTTETRKSLKILSAKCGLSIEDMVIELIRSYNEDSNKK